jgi:NADH-quinone oxidoreductase subunit C
VSTEASTTPATLHGCLLGDSRGQAVLFVPKSAYMTTMKKLVDDGFEMCVDLTAEHFLTHASRTLPDGVAPERFEVVVNLLSLSKRERLRVRVQVSEADPTIDSLFDLYPGTEAMEREAFDMFGISFAGHPDLTRILMPEDWQGHPLRKDYAQGRIPVQFKGAAS